MIQFSRTAIQLRRALLPSLLPLLAFSPGADLLPDGPLPEEDLAARPNIVWVLADDQGYGDFGFMGNEEIHTPNLDRMASASTWMTKFYVTPVCSTTRACLMTGRFNQRAGVLENGSPIFEDEVTIADRLGTLGYATGIFGKWHLGRHYPLRPMDMGFDEVLSFQGGVLRELEEQPVRIRYSDPMLNHNGEIKRFEGFATDVFFDSALDWMKLQSESKKPFFAYIAPAAPHGPLDDIPADTRALYSEEQLERLGETNIKIYSLVSKIDQNMGKLLKGIETLGISKNTLVVYLSDNGPSYLNDERFMSDIRGHKGDILEGGIRTPMLAYWPGTLPADKIEHSFGSVLDLAPTVLAMCAHEPSEPTFDGRSLLGLWNGSDEKSHERDLFFQVSSKGNIELNYAVKSGKWKMALPSGYFARQMEGFGLYDLEADPGEAKSRKAAKPELFESLVQAHKLWRSSWLHAENRDRWQVVNKVREGVRTRRIYRLPSKIWIGNGVEEPMLLTRELGPTFGDAEWLLEVREPAKFQFQLRFPDRQVNGQAKLILDRFEGRSRETPDEHIPRSGELELGMTRWDSEPIELGIGTWRLRADIQEGEEQAEKGQGVWQVLVTQSE